MRSTLAARQSPFRALRTRSSTRHPVCEKDRREYFQTTCFRETTTREKNVWEDASFRSRAPLLTRHRAAA